MKHIFLLSGYAESGKDSTANFLKQKLSGKTLILHFADYLKYIAKQYMEWSGTKNEYGRTLLQHLGTERVRLELNKPLYWAERACDVIEILEKEYDYFCIADLRYINELHYPKSRFPGKVTAIRVIRPDFENCLTEEQRNHISETELENYPHDHTIVSTSGLDNLEIAVDQFLYVFLKNK